MAAVLVRPRSTRILGRIVLLAILLFVLLAGIAYGPQLWAWGQSWFLPSVQTLEIPTAQSEEALALAAEERGMSVQEYTEFQAFQKSQLAAANADPAQTGVAVAASDAAPVAEATVVLPGDVMQQLSLLGYPSFEAFAAQWGLKVGMDKANGQVDPRELTVCPFEVNGCVRLLREKDEYNNIIPFYVSNQTGCWHDGWRREVGVTRPGGYTVPTRSGIPPQFSGLIEGMTVRQCRQQDGTSGTLPTAGSPQQVNNPVVSPVGGNLVGLRIVPSTNLYVRSGPGTEYPEVGRFDIGAAATVVEQQPGLSWLKVRLDRGLEGWVAGWLTSANLPAPVVQNSTVSPSAPIATPAPNTGGATGKTFAATVVSGSVAWETCEGSNRCWNTYKNGDGKPVQMNIACQTDGTRIMADGSEVTGLPPGTHSVTGITDRGCGG